MPSDLSTTKARCLCGRYIKRERGLCDDCFDRETKDAYERVIWRI